jgi:uncharacterized protein (TIGR02246 family)
MRRFALMTTLVVASLAPTARADDKPAAVDPQAKAALERWHEALKGGDAEAIRKLMAEDALITNPVGRIQTRAELMEAFRSGRLKITSLEMSDLRTRKLGDAVAANYQVTIKAGNRGEEVDSTFRYTTIFSKNGDDWQIVLALGTFLGGR